MEAGAGSDVEVMQLIADCLRGMEDPDVAGVTVFGGGARLPTVRVDHASGGRTYLAPEIGRGTPAPVRAGFIDFVAQAITTADQSTIVRVGSEVTLGDGPTGLTVTTSDGWEMVLRAMSIDVPGLPVGRPASVALFGEGVVNRPEDSLT